MKPFQDKLLMIFRSETMALRNLNDFFELGPWTGTMRKQSQKLKWKLLELPREGTCILQSGRVVVFAVVVLFFF